MYGKSRIDHWEEGFFDVFLFVLFVDKKKKKKTLHLKLVNSKQRKRK